LSLDTINLFAYVVYSYLLYHNYVVLATSHLFLREHKRAVRSKRHLVVKNHSISEINFVFLSFYLHYYFSWFCTTYGRELLEFLGMSRQSHSDDIDANQLIALLKMKDEELQAVLSKGLIRSIYCLNVPQEKCIF